MTGRRPASASVVTPAEGAKLCAPAAERNADALCELLRAEAPRRGTALEIASGTGQHVVAFARTCPDLHWQPTEVEEARLASIDAYRQEAGLSNIAPPQKLDATQSGWHEAHRGISLIVLVNLLHLVSGPQAQTLVTEALAALAPGGRFLVYGPFMRGGVLTSDGDARFHAQLSAADPDIGYKDDAAVESWLTAAGATAIKRVEMPANNLAFIATR